MRRAIVLAAGKGTRLVSDMGFPKPMKRVAGVPLIVRVLRGLERARITEVVVVIGYGRDALVEGLRKYRFDLDLRYVVNDEFDKPNGTSLLAAGHLVDGPTFVLMSDHLFSPAVLDAVSSYPLADDEAVLGVDWRIDRCFDVDDATKVRVAGDHLVAIGKELVAYDAIDTGVFRINEGLVEALRAVSRKDRGCSLSEGVAALARRGKMRVVDVRGATWIDVDTPAAHLIAERLVRLYGDELRAPLDLPAATLALGA
jgi:1L-myo-inositol 1-phosphate cytidylyltransferase